MKIALIQVPYDSGHRLWRAGEGPGFLVRAGASARLERAGHEVTVTSVEAWDTPAVEIRTAFELGGALAAEVRRTTDAGALPIVLAGNCNSALGGLTGMDDGPVALVWFDAHGDLHTPETTTSGFLDGMGLATAVGLGWRALMEGSGLRTIPPSQAVLVGARDLDDAERRRLEAGEVAWVRPGEIRERGAGMALAPALEVLAGRARRVYVHIDMDVLDPSVCRANRLSADGGLSLDELLECIRAIASVLPIGGAGIASIEPAFERDGRTAAAALATLEALAAAAGR